MPNNQESPRFFRATRRTSTDFPEKVDAGGFEWSTARFRKNVDRGDTEQRSLNAQLARLEIQHPEILITPENLENASLIQAISANSEWQAPAKWYILRLMKESKGPTQSDPPLNYLEACELQVSQLAEAVASRDLPKVGITGAGPIYDVLRANFEKDMVTPKGFDENGFANYMLFLPPFESEVFQHLLSAQFARRAMIELAKSRSNYGCGPIIEQEKPNKKGIKRIISVHSSPRRLGYNEHVLLHYLIEAFRFNISVIPDLAKISDLESKFFTHLVQWGRETAIGYDTRGHNLRTGRLNLLTQWMIPTEKVLS